MAVAVTDGVAVRVGVWVADGVAVVVTDDVDVTLGVGVGQGTVVVSDIIAFMRRNTVLPSSDVNISPTSVRATPTGFVHREAIPPVLVTYPEVVLPAAVVTVASGSVTRRMAWLFRSATNSNPPPECTAICCGE